jgi:hypothetical protein
MGLKSDREDAAAMALQDAQTGAGVYIPDARCSIDATRYE